MGGRPAALADQVDPARAKGPRENSRCSCRCGS
jgi:hypothetical protein